MRTWQLKGPYTAALVAALLVPATSRGGGFEIPDNGAEALGRGGAFVAKADSPLAMYYNVAGIARQEGVRLTVDANFVLHDTAFTRAGVYPGDPNAMPWAGQPYPTVHDAESMFLIPAGGITWGIPWVKNLGVGFGMYGPHAIGKHRYGDETQVAVGGTDTVQYTSKLANGTTAPTPSRYDLTSTDLLILQPTFGIAYGPVKYIDVGVAFQLNWGSFNLMNANMTPLGSACVGLDDPGCDSYGQVKASGFGYTGLVSLLAHPAPWMDVGVQFRPKVAIHATGQLHAYVPAKFPAPQPDNDITFDTALPHKLSFGVRAVSRYLDGTERADIELDGTWEKWSDIQADTVHAPDFAFGDLIVDIPHHYRDTFGARLGGAYNYRLRDDMRLIGRAGFYFDSAATAPEDTHLDFDTAVKYALTLGAGFKIKGFTINLAYAWVHSPDRDVQNGRLHPVSSFTGTQYAANDPIASYVYNNGLYQYSTHIVSVGLSFNFNEFRRSTLYPN